MFLEHFLIGSALFLLTRKTDKYHGKSTLQPGTIMSAPFHSQCEYDIINANDASAFLSGFGPSFSKYRKIIVLEAWSEHCICVPMYS